MSPGTATAWMRRASSGCARANTAHLPSFDEQRVRTADAVPHDEAGAPPLDDGGVHLDALARTWQAR
jgi:hypothetical protein